MKRLKHPCKFLFVYHKTPNSGNHWVELCPNLFVIAKTSMGLSKENEAVIIYASVKKHFIVKPKVIESTFAVKLFESKYFNL